MRKDVSMGTIIGGIAAPHATDEFDMSFFHTKPLDHGFGSPIPAQRAGWNKAKS